MSLVLALLASSPAAGPAQGELRTRWTDQVSPVAPWPEYPRPELRRERWQSLNGPWEHAVRAAGQEPPTEWDGPILVPFPLESRLSGVGRALKPDEELWYRRDVVVPDDWPEGRVLLHFGAVDWRARVLVDGRDVGSHEGGYDPFTLDLGALAPGARHEVVVAVQDPTDTGVQPRGKQTLRPEGIWYTAVSGIWQTVWWEPVPELALAAVRVEHLGGDALKVIASIRGARDGPGGDLRLEARVLRDGRELARASGPAPSFELEVPGLETWSPEHPTLYDLELALVRGEEPLDRVVSYFGARTIAVRPDADGTPRLFLNGEPRFQYGLLDQGYWPDGLYCPPTDEALVYDLEVTKRLGFDLVRKHVKVEPARWYWHADRLGLLVWQDLPSGGKGIGPEDPDLALGAREAAVFRGEAQRIVDALLPHPSVVCWVLFNEGWGQHDTVELAGWLAAKDPTRLVNATSGWADRGVGHLVDAHRYPGPGMPAPSRPRAAVLGEFGGLGLPLEGHTWVGRSNWGYRSYASRTELVDAYLELVAALRPLRARGLAAAVYTQTTDVETEVNGVLTYDRAVLKLDDPRVREAHARLRRPPARIETLLSSAQEARAHWRYRFEPPAADWTQLEFDDSGWAEGPGGFGSEGTPGALVGTRWEGADVWLRRRFELPTPPGDGTLWLRIHHDEDAEVFLNGVRVAALSGYMTGYVDVALDETARAALRAGANVLALHGHQTRGGQYLDTGLEVLREREPGANADDARSEIMKEPWGAVDGTPVELYTLRNRRGTTLRVATYGAIVTELHVRDRDGAFEDVVLGFDSLAGYLGDEHPYFGCVAGRCANRIAGAAFELDGRRYELAANDGRNHLHGGRRGFDRHVWDARPEPTAQGPSLVLERVSPDGEEGYPGRVVASVRYTLTDADVLRVEMEATSDAPTLVNLVQHAYWNLGGHASGTIDEHVLRFHASRYVPVDGELVPLGRFEPVQDTPFDFRTPKAIGTDLRSVDAGPSLPRGYDHDLVIDGEPRSFRPVCELVDPASGRRLELWADQPGCQLYTGNFLDGTLSGKAGARYVQYAGLCLETQLHPDSIHRPDWPSPVLRPGERYEHRMELRFGVEPR